MAENNDNDSNDIPESDEAYEDLEEDLGNMTDDPTPWGRLIGIEPDDSEEEETDD